jgi:glutathione S-transferase
VKLYNRSNPAPNPRRVRIFLAEKGIQVPYEEVDTANFANRSPAFLQKNPMGTVPVLELDDGTCIAESVAICRYFEELQPDPPLLGIDGRDRALVEMWQRRMEFEIFWPTVDTARHQIEFFKGRMLQSPEYANVCRQNAARGFAWLNTVLADRPFVAGERYTIADITALCAVDFGQIPKIVIQPEHAHLQRWYEAVSTRPSAKA